MGRSGRALEKTPSDLEDLFHELRGVDLGSEAAMRSIRALLHRRAETIPLLLRQFEIEDEEGLALASLLLRSLDDPSIVPALLNLLQAPRVGELAKGLLLNLLEHYGLDTQDPSLIGAFIDLQAVLRGQGDPQAAE